MAYNPADAAGLNGRNPYDAARKNAVDTAQGAGQNSMDAITRRYAAMGNLNSGSYAKQVENVGRDTQQAQQDAVGKVDMGEIQNAMPFQMQERQFGQQDKQLAQQESQFQRELPLKQRSLDLEASQQGLDAKANEINANLAGKQLERSGGLFGGGGFLGTGIGGGK